MIHIPTEVPALEQAFELYHSRLNCLYAMIPCVIAEDELVQVIQTIKDWFRI